MKTKTLAQALTTLAALTAVICAYSTMPEGRALTEKERMMAFGRGSCKVCKDLLGRCPTTNIHIYPDANVIIDPPPPDGTLAKRCDGHFGAGVVDSDEEDGPATRICRCESQLYQLIDGKWAHIGIPAGEEDKYSCGNYLKCLGPIGPCGKPE